MKLTYLTENLQTKTPHLIKTIQKQRKEYSEEQTQQLINYANMADPTGEKATYTPWIIKQELKNNIQLPEDIVKISEYLTKYDQLKKLTGFEGRKDINQYQTFNDLTSDVDKAAELNSKRKQIKADKASGAKKVYDDGDVKIIQILTPEASVQYAKHTKWCTSVLEKAKEYLDDEELGGLFIFIMGGEKFQFTGSLSEFMDARNDPVEFSIGDYVKVFDILKDNGIVSEDVLRSKKFSNHLNINSVDVINLIKLIENGYIRFGDIAENPTILSLLDPWLIKLEPYILKDAKSAYLYAKNVIGSRWSDAEEIIMKDPRYAYRYAVDVMGGRWLEAEPYIMKDPRYACRYAHDIIQNRWPEAEPYIVKDPESTYEYVRDVLNNKRWPEAEPAIMKNPMYAFNYTLTVLGGERWPEAEPTIMKDPEAACRYAHDIIQNRWPEAEPYIMKNPESAYWYAMDVIKGRWPEAEEIIMKDPRYAYRYAYHIIRGRWPEAEPTIMKSPHSAYNYAMDVIKGRWPEAEEIIIKDPHYAYNYAMNVIGGRWPEAEEIIIKDPHYAYHYTLDVIGGRWPEAEPTIMGDPEYAHYYLTDVVKNKNEIQQLKKEYNL